jgi:hypothetical protein
LHEARLKKLGLEDNESESEEADDMSQQVLIRSPIVHNHYHQQPDTSAAEPPVTQPEPNNPNLSGSLLSRLWPLVAMALIGSGLGAGAISFFGGYGGEPPTAVDTDTQYELAPLRISSGEPDDTDP